LIAVNGVGDDYTVTPLFVSVTAAMNLRESFATLEKEI
jgi:hypothetical protein